MLTNYMSEIPIIKIVIKFLSSLPILTCITGSALANTDSLTAESFDCVRDMTAVRGGISYGWCLSPGLSGATGAD